MHGTHTILHFFWLYELIFTLCMVHTLSCIFFGFTSRFLHYAWYTHYPAFFLVLQADFYTMHGTHTILHFLGRTFWNHNAPQDSPWPSTYSYWAHPRYMTKVFLLQSSHSTVTQESALPALFQIMSFHMLNNTWRQYAKHQLRHLYHLIAQVTVFLHPTAVIP